MSAPSPANPGFLPFKLDLVMRRVLWVRVSAAQRASAAFLDERGLPAEAEGGWLPLQSLAAADADGGAADGLFHIGHCGSTLLSRLLQHWPGVQSLREPLPLRTLAAAWPERGRPESRLAPGEDARLLQSLWAAWARPVPPGERVVVKASSQCNGLIESLMAHAPATRVVLLDMPLQAWLAALLKSPGATLDASAAAGERLRDLRARGLADGVALHRLSLPEQLAMGWLAERLRFDAIARGQHRARVLRVDFEDLLARPQQQLQRIASHLRLDPAGVDSALQARDWHRYSKAQAHGYNRDDRAHDLALSAARHREQIAVAVDWLADRLRPHPALAGVIET